MSEFTVIAVIDGDTFTVKGGWKWNDETGDDVRPTGYDAPEEGEPGYEQAKQKLAGLILGKIVDIPKAYKVDRGRLVADVCLNGKNLADYFPEYQS